MPNKTVRLMTSRFVIALLIWGASAQGDGCVENPDGSQSCNATVDDAMSLLQRQPPRATGYATNLRGVFPPEFPSRYFQDKPSVVFNNPCVKTAEGFDSCKPTWPTQPERLIQNTSTSGVRCETVETDLPPLQKNRRYDTHESWAKDEWYKTIGKTKKNKYTDVWVTGYKKYDGTTYPYPTQPIDEFPARWSEKKCVAEFKREVDIFKVPMKGPFKPEFRWSFDRTPEGWYFPKHFTAETFRATCSAAGMKPICAGDPENSYLKGDCVPLEIIKDTLTWNSKSTWGNWHAGSVLQEMAKAMGFKPLSGWKQPMGQRQQHWLQPFFSNICLMVECHGWWARVSSGLWRTVKNPNCNAFASGICGGGGVMDQGRGAYHTQNTGGTATPMGSGRVTDAGDLKDRTPQPQWGEMYPVGLKGGPLYTLCACEKGAECSKPPKAAAARPEQPQVVPKEKCGTVRNSGTNKLIEGVTVEVKNLTYTTQADGKFCFKLKPKEKVKLKIKKKGHIPTTKEVTVPTGDDPLLPNPISMSENLQPTEWRIVHQWQDKPDDLDIKLWFGSGKDCELNYTDARNKSKELAWKTCKSNKVKAELELDERNISSPEPRPETVRLQNVDPKTCKDCYVFYTIHDYTNWIAAAGNPAQFSESKSTVKVFHGKKEVSEFHFDAKKSQVKGYDWDVFKIEVKSGKVIECTKAATCQIPKAA